MRKSQESLRKGEKLRAVAELVEALVLGFTRERCLFILSLDFLLLFIYGKESEYESRKRLIPNPTPRL